MHFVYCGLFCLFPAQVAAWDVLFAVLVMAGLLDPSVMSVHVVGRRLSAFLHCVELASMLHLLDSNAAGHAVAATRFQLLLGMPPPPGHSPASLSTHPQPLLPSPSFAPWLLLGRGVACMLQ